MPAIVKIAFAILIAASLGTPVYSQPHPTAEDLLKMSSTVERPGRIEAHAHVTVGEREYDTIVWSTLTEDGLGDASFKIINTEGVREYKDIGGARTLAVDQGDPQALPAGMGAFIHGHQFHRRYLFPEAELASFEPQTTAAEFAGRSSWRIDGSTPDGSLLSYHFDQETRRMLGFQLTVFESESPRPMDFVMKDWRDRDGLPLFWRLEISDKGDVFIYEFNQILLLP